MRQIIINRLKNLIAHVPTLIISATFILSLGGCATLTATRPAPVTVDQIVTMSKQGTPPQDIIKVIRDSGTAYRLSASQLADLRQIGVSDQVIDYMQQTYLDAVRRDQALSDMSSWYGGPGGYWYGGAPYGWW